MNEETSQNKERERAHYGHWVPIPTRWMDNDVYGHVNNVTYYSYFDTAVNDFLVREGGLDFHKGDVVGFVVASGCQYLKPIAFPNALQVGVRVNRLGNSSVEYGVAVFKEQDPLAVAVGYFTHVFVSRGSQRPAPMPAQIRAALTSLFEAKVES
ncbi:MAG: acyl-CoA thioesterase [Gammaproteobacteria bacterium]